MHSANRSSLRYLKAPSLGNERIARRIGHAVCNSHTVDAIRQIQGRGQRSLLILFDYATRGTYRSGDRLVLGGDLLYSDHPLQLEGGCLDVLHILGEGGRDGGLLGGSGRRRPSGHGRRRGVHHQRQVVIVARGDGRNATQVRGDAALAVGVVTPGDYRTVILERQAVKRARGDGRNATQVRGDVGLAVGVVTPGDYRTVILECQAVMQAPGDGRNATQVRGDAALAVVVPTPGDYRTAILERQAVIPAPGDGRNATQVRGDAALAVGVVTPGDYRTVILKC